VRAAESLIREQLDEEFFQVRFEKAIDREREYMAAMRGVTVQESKAPDF
jgi:hypothetical protein